MIKNFLFKPVVIKLDNLEKLIIIFNLESSTSKTINSDGKEYLRNKTYIEVLDVTSTVSTGNPVTEIIEITDEGKLISQFELVDECEDNEEILEDLSECTKILNANVSFLKQRIDSVSNALNSINLINNYPSPEDDKEGNLIIGTDSGKLAHIVFNTIQGNTASLNDKDVKHIGSVIMDTMMANLDIDLDNNKEVDKLIDNLELKIIDSLPQTLKAGNITINKNGLLKEIQSCRDQFLHRR